MKSSSKGIRLSKWVRRTHLFMALFLTPWIVMYALSTLAMHHRVLFTGQERRVEPSFATLHKQSNYRPDVNMDSTPEAVALRILKDEHIEGAFSVSGNLNSGSLTITRDRPIGSYRLTYDPQAETLLVERQGFGLSYFLEMLHRRRGYSQDYVANDVWALIVDGVIVAIVLWSVTGLWMWLEMSRTRRLGAAFVGSGVLLFCLLLWVL